ncbi:hypothetical protein DUNSADRAFT_9931 [Dunaliella salina]|uniref:tRNA-intron lyase n=1 Tax=Dunaliella salina TaxID=3046 RepID=A0ABQ7GGH1_DUNSA|nr:hypothetical protein DUNSADRAFT_9931 [Dunaliella salina]|eukprot:KAF5833698.1 hypothetical protein DUNSADRAFT_9931 [Dunaliella salina]
MTMEVKDQQQKPPIFLHAVHAPHQGLQCWEPEGAVRLRRDHRLLGSLVGGVSQFKNQNAVNGLPLVLGPDEAAIAVQQGWAKVCPPALEVALEDQEEHQLSGIRADSVSARASRIDSKRERAGRRRGRFDWLQDSSEEYFAYYERLGAFGRNARLRRLQEGARGQPNSQQQQQQQQQHLQQQQQLQESTFDTSQGGGQQQRKSKGQQQQQQQHPLPQQTQQHELQPYMRAEAFSRARQPGCAYKLAMQLDATPPGAWKEALAECSNFHIPLRAGTPGRIVKTQQEEQAQQHQQKQEPAKKKQKQVGQGKQEQQRKEQEQQQQQQQKEQEEQHHREQQMQAEAAAQPCLPLGYPASSAQDLRFRLFRDMHAQGYALSAGPKFGADLLAYPGDPSLFHAQVKVCGGCMPLDLRVLVSGKCSSPKTDWFLKVQVAPHYILRSY